MYDRYQRGLASMVSLYQNGNKIRKESECKWSASSSITQTSD